MSEWRDTRGWAETHRRRELLNLSAEMTLGEATEELNAPTDSLRLPRRPTLLRASRDRRD